MLHRKSAFAEIARRLNNGPAAVLLGPRQVGKTTLARQIAKEWTHSPTLHLDLERPSDVRKLDDADNFLRAQSGCLVILDEIQRAPELFPILRNVIDDRRAAGETSAQFLLLGSASLDLVQGTSESLAGRIAYVEITPFNALEAADAQIDNETLWQRGGFPSSLLAADDRGSLDWRRDFLRSVIERDIPFFAPRLPAQTLGRLWTMLAHQQGAPLNQAQLAAALGVQSVAVTRYLDLMCDLMLVRRLTPWSGNGKKRLSKTPKVYVRDSGLTHALLEIPDWNTLVGHPVCGLSYEGFVLNNVIAAATPHYQAHYYRTHDGAEIDLLLSLGGEPHTAIEVKRSSAPTVSRGFTVACDDLAIAPERRFLVYPGEAEYHLRSGVQVIGLANLMLKFKVQ